MALCPAYDQPLTSSSTATSAAVSANVVAAARVSSRRISVAVGLTSGRIHGAGTRRSGSQRRLALAMIAVAIRRSRDEPSALSIGRG